MKAIIVEEAGKIAIRDIPEPVMGEYDALVEVVAGSLCNSTDTKILHGEFVGPLPTILGHEAVGRVVEIGPKVRTYHLGDLVVRPRIGSVPSLNLSSSFGSFVEYGLATDAWAQAEDEGRERPSGHDQIASDGNSDPQTLIQAITLKETLSFLRNLGVDRGQSILIFGTGPVGVSFSLWAGYLGCENVIVVGRRDEACARAKEFGRATHTINNTKEHVPDAVRDIVKTGVTFAIEAIGDNNVLRDCIDSLAPDGQVGMYGVPPDSQGRSPLLDDPRISGAGPREAIVHDEVMEQIQKGTIPARELLTQEIDYRECARGFELLQELKQEGLIQYTGLGGTTAYAMARIMATGQYDVVLTAFNSSPLWREAMIAVIPEARKQNMGVLLASPTQQGWLARRFDKEIESGALFLSPPRRAQIKALYELCDDCGIEIPVFCLRWALGVEGVSTVLTGPRNVEQLEQNIQAVEQGPLPGEVIKRLDEIAAVVPFRPFDEPFGCVLGNPDYWGPGVV